MAKKPEEKKPIRKEVKLLGLKGALSALKSQYGKRALFVEPTRRYIPMRHHSLGRVISGDRHPGLPTGSYIEIVGAEFAGKTTLTFAMIDAVINQPAGAKHFIRTDDGIIEVPPPRKAVVLDFEHAIDTVYLRKAVRNVVLAIADAEGNVLNPAEANVYIVQPETLEEGCDVMIALIQSGEFGIGIMDSVPAMLTIGEQKKSMGENTMAETARGLGKFFRKATGIVNMFGTTVVLVNQWRDKPGIAFGDPRVSPGGKAIRYFNTIKLDVSGPRKSTWFPDGKIVNVKTMKNKITGTRDVVAAYHAGDGLGISAEVELIERAAACGVVKFTGVNRPVSLLSSTGKIVQKYNDAYELIEALHTKPKLWEAVSTAVAKRGTDAVIASKGRGAWDDGED